MSHINLSGYSDSTRKHLMNGQRASLIAHHLPERIQLRPEWRLKYSLEQHGASLKTLYEQSNPHARDHQQRGYLIVIKDARNGVFGAYSNEHLKPSDGRYRGNGDCFLWKLNGEESITAYNYTGKNDFMVFCTKHFISFGGGDGHYGLWVDDSLEKGVTYQSLTYGNDVLSVQGSKFDVIGLEVWEI